MSYYILIFSLIAFNTCAWADGWDVIDCKGIDAQFVTTDREGYAQGKAGDLTFDKLNSTVLFKKFVFVGTAVSALSAPLLMD